jgi:lipopolysaccharide export system protein LptA
MAASIEREAPTSISGGSMSLDQKLKKVHFTYNVEKFVTDVTE